SLRIGTPKIELWETAVEEFAFLGCKGFSGRAANYVPKMRVLRYSKRSKLLAEQARKCVRLTRALMDEFQRSKAIAERYQQPGNLADYGIHSCFMWRCLLILSRYVARWQNHNRTRKLHQRKSLHCGGAC